MSVIIIYFFWLLNVFKTIQINICYIISFCSSLRLVNSASGTFFSTGSSHLSLGRPIGLFPTGVLHCTKYIYKSHLMLISSAMFSFWYISLTSELFLILHFPIFTSKHDRKMNLRIVLSNISRLLCLVLWSVHVSNTFHQSLIIHNLVLILLLLGQ